MRLWICYILLLADGFAKFESSDRSHGEFHGRASKVNEKANLIRVKVDFHNLRYLLKGDSVNFSNNAMTEYRCWAIVEGKTNDYILLRVNSFKQCMQQIGFSVGSYLYFYSEDLVKNIAKGKEVLDILLKKRMAINARKERLAKELDTYRNKMDAVNSRYDVLREKLEKERKEKVLDLKNESAIYLSHFKEAEIRLGEADYKLEQYRISDQNVELDKWSLDKKLYFKK